MAQMDTEMLSSVVVKFLEQRGKLLSPAERTEALRIAQGVSCKSSALASGISYETIRARRKRMYRKLGVSGSTELISSFLLVSLGLLDATGAGARATQAPAAPPPQVDSSLTSPRSVGA